MLNDDEMKIAEQLLKGLSDKDICFSLKISYKTLRLKLKNIYKKHDVQTRYQLILKLFKST